MKLRPLGISAFIAITFFSCNLDDCAECRLIIEDANGKIIEEKTPKTYCNEALKAKEQEDPVEWEGETSYYFCQ